MSDSTLSFPPGAKSFFLRSDFADELGFPDFCCDEKLSSRLCAAANNPGLIPDSVPTDPELDVSGYIPRRYLVYCGLGLIGTRIPHYHIYDGWRFMPISRRGLFASMLLCAEATEGRKLDAVILPPESQRPRERSIWGSHSILHDTWECAAAFVASHVINPFMDSQRK